MHPDDRTEGLQCAADSKHHSAPLQNKAERDAHLSLGTTSVNTMFSTEVSVMCVCLGATSVNTMFSTEVSVTCVFGSDKCKYNVQYRGECDVCVFGSDKCKYTVQYSAQVQHGRVGKCKWPQ